jgi:non-specific serine/threonine protein kinase
MPHGITLKHCERPGLTENGQLSTVARNLKPWLSEGALGSRPGAAEADAPSFAPVASLEKQQGVPMHNLPVPLTTLVGRARELQALGETLRKTRLVTLTGPGGVGKTRLGLAVAHGQIARRADGVWLVDLASGPDTPDVAEETARVLEVGKARGATAVSALRSFLADRDLLLVLDNCEHVVEQSAQLAFELLSSCAAVRVLATSREALGVIGETVWRLEPLEPEDAGRLFIERARQRRPELVVSGRADAAIVQLCERLDRLPLAIELAAGRVGAMSVEEILASLDQRIGDLGGSGRLSPAHHRSVRAAVAWSYELLEHAEQQAFRRLSVFVAGFDAAAAKAVAEAPLELIARLVEKSLIAVRESPHGSTRYRLLETVREYARALLVEAGEEGAARERHFRHFSSLADIAREEWLQTGRSRITNELEDDYENVRAALDWATRSEPCAGVAMVAGTRDLFYKFGQGEGFRLAQLLLEQCPTQDRHRAEAQIAAGQLASATGDLTAAKSVLAQARELSRQLGEPVLEASASWFQGVTELVSGEPTAGREHLETSRALYRELGIRIGEARALAGLAGTFQFANEPERAKELLETALEIYAAEDDRWGQGQCHTFLGMIAEDTRNDWSEATAHYRRAVELLRPFSDTTLLPVALLGQAGVVARQDRERALRLVAAAIALRARAGGEFQPVFRDRANSITSGAETALGDRFDEVWAAGTRLGLDEAIALAFGTARPRARAAPSGLSARELEVVLLVADGLANKAVAGQLHLSVRTVESHVRHALAKLGLENRTQLAAWAHERRQ